MRWRPACRTAAPAVYTMAGVNTQEQGTGTMMKRKAVFLCDSEPNVRHVYGAGRFERVAAATDLYPVIVSKSTFDEHAAKLGDVEAVFSTWGMPGLTPQQQARLGSLKAIFYGAGSVKGFAEPYLDRGVLVVSAWGANAVPVAEFTLAQILLACKGYFRNTCDCRDPEKRHSWKVQRGKGIFGERVALIGAGMIGRTLIGLLKAFVLEVVVVDPYLPDADAAQLGVRKVTLEEAFRTAYVVSNHLPNIPATVGLLNKPLFASLRTGATFINTGRGAQVVEADLIAVLQQRPDLTALLDVTDPEPPAKDSPFYTLPNVQLSSHIAGSMNDEVVRMADYMLEEYSAWAAGKPLRYAVSKDMLGRMA